MRRHDADANRESVGRQRAEHILVGCIVSDRQHAALTTRVLQVAAAVLLITLAPLLINGSIWVAMRLDELTAAVYAWLSSPLVLVGVALVALAALATKWARIW